MNRFTGRPAKPEHADWDAEGAYEGGRETFLGFEFAVLVELRFLNVVQVSEEGADDYETAD